jgi:hypothetical protein
MAKQSIPADLAAEPERPGPRSADLHTAAPAARATPQWWRRPWVVPLFLVILGFLIYIWPPYLGLDPSRSRVPINPAEPGQYPLLVAHIICGTVALLTLCLQLWPWLRNSHPAIHRWSGRVYVFGGALPSALLIAVLIPQAGTPLGSVGFGVAGFGWLVTTIMGYIRARQRRYREHRRWMLYNFAFATNQIWTRFFYILMVNVAHQGHNMGLVSQVGEASTWIGFTMNVWAVQWWLNRTPRRRRPALGLQAR